MEKNGDGNIAILKIFVKNVLIFLGFVSVISVKSYSQQELPIQEISISVETTLVKHALVLPERIEYLAATDSMALFASNRSVWIKKIGKSIVRMDNLFLPEECDWFQTAGSAGRNIILGVAGYKEEQRKKDLNTARGGFKAGPYPIGLILVQPDPLRVKLIKHFILLDQDYLYDTLQIGYLESSYWDGNKLLIGTYGYLAEVDLENETASLIEDDEFPINRIALLKENSAIWEVKDEGGAGGGWIEKHVRDNVLKYYPLNLNSAVIYADAIIRYKNKILTSSLAGVVEIDEVNNRYIHYQLTTNPLTMRVYKLKTIDDCLWGLREDGWVKIDIEKNSAILYQFIDKTISNNIYGVIKFEEVWYVATENALVTAVLR